LLALFQLALFQRGAVACAGNETKPVRAHQSCDISDAVLARHHGVALTPGTFWLGSALGPMLNLQWLAGLNQLSLLAVLLDRLRALRQRGFVEQGQERREPLAVDQPEDFDVALRRCAPACDFERALRLGEESVVAEVWAAALGRPAGSAEPASP